MAAIVGNFIFILGVIAIIAELVKPQSQTGKVVDSLSGLLTNSIKAAKN
jgi:hypothetical protein